MGHFLASCCQLDFTEIRRQWVAFFAVSATARSSEESMGEHGIHGMVSKGLLFQDVGGENVEPWKTV